MKLFESIYNQYYTVLVEKMIDVNQGEIDIDSIGDEVDEDDLFDQVDNLERNSPINVLRGKDLTMIYLNDGKVVGALYVEMEDDVFSFDILVDEENQGNGIGSKLLDAAIQEFNYNKDDNDTLTVRLDVVNDLMKKALEKRGLEVKEDNKDRWIMGYPEDEPEDDSKEDSKEEPKEDPKEDPEEDIKEYKMLW